MNKVWIYFAKISLNALKVALKRLDEKKIKEIADKINKKIDIPGITEETEEKVYVSTLTTFVVVTEELLNLVKI